MNMRQGNNIYSWSKGRYGGEWVHVGVVRQGIDGEYIVWNL